MGPALPDEPESAPTAQTVLLLFSALHSNSAPQRLLTLKVCWEKLVNSDAKNCSELRDA